MKENQNGSFLPHIIQYPPEISFCAGCTACEIVCSLLHDGFNSPQNRRILLERGTSTMEHTICVCQQCADHPCYNACPRKDKAMKIDEELKIAYVVTSECIGCGLCVKACPFEPKLIYINKDKKAIKCDLCRGRPEGPACVEYCQVRCIGFSNQPLPVELED
jgi:Fe-S-cluster-containing hydrogenase component 2